MQSVLGAARLWETEIATQELESPSDGLPRRYFSIAADSIDDLVSSVSVTDGQFVLFLACDATGLSDEDIHRMSVGLIEKGIAYLVAWGPDCSRLHDRFDLAEATLEVDTGIERWTMTSWHDKETFEDAFYFFLFDAIPDDIFEMTCNTAIAASIAHPEWATKIRGVFADVESLKAALGP